jgi:uncharacterized membrane protein
LQIITYTTIFANVPVFREILWFFYLLFIPGVIILKLLSLKSLGVSEKILYSIGLSVAFLMFVGTTVSVLGELITKTPLSLDTLTISINIILLLMALIGSLRSTSDTSQNYQRGFLSYSLLVSLCVSLLILGSYGIFLVNSTGNNFLIILLIIAISVLVPTLLFKVKVIHSDVYPLILCIIFVCTLLFVSTGTSLVTPYFTGTSDQWVEYYAFRQTGQLWNYQNSNIPMAIANSYYAMPSVTILPTVFLILTNMDSYFLFMLLYPIVASFIAIGVYQLYKTQTDYKTAFLAAFFFIIISVGKSVGPDRQQIGELFYVLLFLVIFIKGISPIKRNVLLIVFSVALVLSHYSLAYIFLFTLFASFLILVVIDLRRTGRVNLFHSKIPFSFVIFFSTITFLWYIYVNGSAAFDPVIQMISTVSSNLNRFFDPASRGTALAGLGVIQAPSILYRISAGLFIFTEILLAIGFFTLLKRKDKNSKYTIEYKVFAFLNLAIIGANILLPNLANTFLMSRFYQITLIILAPLAILGGNALFGFLLRRRFQKFYTAGLIFIVLIPLFLFQTNLVYEISKEKSYDIPLSMYRWNIQELHEYTVSTQEVVGAQWISQFANLSNTPVYSDYIAKSGVLIAYGFTFNSHLLSGINAPSPNSLTYLSDPRLINDNNFQNSSLIPPILENQNKIYSTGSCEIYYNIIPDK